MHKNMYWMYRVWFKDADVFGRTREETLQDTWDQTLLMDFKVKEVYRYMLRDNDLNNALRARAYMMRYTYNWERKVRGV